MKIVTKFYADDGTEFPTAEEVVDYEFIQKLKVQLGWSDIMCKAVLENYGTLHYLIGEYMKNFPDVGFS